MSLEKRAFGWRAQRRRAVALEAAVRILGWGLAAAAAMAAADRLLVLPRPARMAAWLAGAAALVLAVRRELAAPWRAGGWESIFADAARRWPATRPMFSSAWALGGDRGGRGVSEELRREHLARADALAAGLPEEPLYPWKPTRAARAGAFAGAAALALGLAAGASWTRVLAPWLDAPLDRLVVLSPGDAGVDWGALVLLSARLTPEGKAAGLRGADLTLETRGADGAWRAAAWDAVDGESASFETGALTGRLDYRARRRGMVTSVKRLLPVPAPRFKDARAVVHGSRGVKTFILGEDAAARARRGDWVTVRGVSEAPLASALLRLSTLPAPIAMREAGGAWSAGFMAEEDAALSFLLVSRDARRDPSPPVYALSVLGDAKPSVELLSPQVPLQAGPRDSVTIAYAARDDGALTRLELVVHAPKGDVRRALTLERGSAETIGDAALALREHAPGSLVEFWLEAFDDASPPQSARSEKGSVEVVDVDAAHTAALAARERALTALDRAAEAAEAAAKASAAGDDRAARETARRVSGLWPVAAGAVMAWNEAMRDDVRANPGLADQAAAAAESLAAAGMEGLPKAASALERGDFAGSAREQTALAEQARAASSALRAGSSVQSAQDMADRAYDAEREGREIGESIERMKGALAPAQAAELQRALDAVDSALEELRKSIDALPEASPEAGQVRELPLNDARESAAALRRALRGGDAAGAAKAARELAERLSRVAKGLRESGRRVAGGQAGRAKEAAERVAQAWREAVARQEKAVEAARRRENARLAGMVRAQKELLLRTQDAIDSALSSAPSAETERAARAARESLSAGRIDEAVGRLRAAKALHAAAAALERGVGAPVPDPGAAREAADAQASARESAGRLRREVSGAAGLLGFMPGGPVRRIDDAMSEQAASEAFQRRGDAAEGLRRGEAALAILQEGDKDSSGGPSGGGASGMGGAMSRPFEMPGSVVRAAPRGARGSATGRVRLPSADEYRPPRELREELERSLREPRPAAHDSAIKEYFRRLVR
ncbi:MAG: hypothetical protein HY403_11555 [Elusimicrobia bacterium]|nr:hypothetical protein [Elusimicrobiota bacterium]